MGRATRTRVIAFHPVTPDRLDDLARFSQAHGKFRYCSCMRWRLTSTEYRQSTKESRVCALDDLVRRGTPIGVLAYDGDQPVGWCSIAPRETYGALERFRALTRVDDEPVWSVVCFFVHARARRRRLTEGLLRAAVDYALANGATIIEGYPVEPGQIYTYMGSPDTFLKIGFTDVTPKGRTRRVMRLVL